MSSFFFPAHLLAPPTEIEGYPALVDIFIPFKYRPIERTNAVQVGERLLKLRILEVFWHEIFEARKFINENKVNYTRMQLSDVPQEHRQGLKNLIIIQALLVGAPFSNAVELDSRLNGYFDYRVGLNILFSYTEGEKLVVKIDGEFRNLLDILNEVTEALQIDVTKNGKYKEAFSTVIRIAAYEARIGNIQKMEKALSDFVLTHTDKEFREKALAAAHCESACCRLSMFL